MKTVNPSADEVNEYIDLNDSYPVRFKIATNVCSDGYLIKQENRHNKFSFTYIDKKSGFKVNVCFGFLLDHPCLSLSMTDAEKISDGICISDRGVDHCTSCIDYCEAAHFKIALKELTT